MFCGIQAIVIAHYLTAFYYCLDFTGIVHFMYMYMSIYVRTLYVFMIVAVYVCVCI